MTKICTCFIVSPLLISLIFENQYLTTHFIANSLLNVAVKKLWESVNSLWRYDQKSGWVLFLLTVYSYLAYVILTK